jgi:adenine deaminase
MILDEIIKSAMGEKEADILLTNARVIDVFSGEIVDGDIAIAGGYIVGFGSYPAKRTVDMENRFVSPLHDMYYRICPGHNTVGHHNRFCGPA